MRDWRAADALVAEKQKLDAVDEEMQNAEDTAAPHPARGRPTRSPCTFESSSDQEGEGLKPLMVC